MTLFAEESAAEIPACWRQPHHPLSVPDWLGLLLVKPRKPDDVRDEWMCAAQSERDQTVRLFVLEDRADDGLILRSWDLRTTPVASWWWFRTTSKPAGHRLILTDPSKPNLLDPATHRRLP